MNLGRGKIGSDEKKALVPHSLRLVSLGRELISGCFSVIKEGPHELQDTGFPAGRPL